MSRVERADCAWIVSGGDQIVMCARRQAWGPRRAGLGQLRVGASVLYRWVRGYQELGLASSSLPSHSGDGVSGPCLPWSWSALPLLIDLARRPSARPAQQHISPGQSPDPALPRRALPLSWRRDTESRSGPAQPRRDQIGHALSSVHARLGECWA